MARRGDRIDPTDPDATMAAIDVAMGLAMAPPEHTDPLRHLAALLDLPALEEQAELVGSLAFDGSAVVILTAHQRGQLAGVWNVLHAILDACDPLDPPA